MVGADDVEELIARAYEAGAEPARWPAFLSRLATALSARTCALQIEDLDRATGSLAVVHGVEAATIAAYETHYAAQNPWLRAGASQLAAGCVVTGEMAISTRDLERTAFYAEFLRPQDIAHSAAAVIEHDRRRTSMLTIQRSRRVGALSTDGLALLAQLLPHVQRAVQLQRRLGHARREHEALVETADRMPWGVLFLARDRRVVFANAAVRALSRRMLARVLAAASAGGGVVPREVGAPLTVTITPLRTPDDAVAAAGAHTAVFVIDPDAQRAAPEAVLREGFGLTPAEIRVAIAIARGATLRDITDDTGVAIATVRTHLKRIFSKTGTRRQSELVRLLLLAGIG